MRTSRRTTRLVLGVVALSAAGGVAGCGALSDDEPLRLTAHFDRTVGLYENSDVRILGVKIGKVVDIVPEGTTVRVEMEYDPEYKIPAGAQAVVIAPSIVSDRYVQLTPAYTTGPLLEDGADLGMDRTAVPVELDQIFQAVDRLNVALGPEGANKDGELSDLLSVSADNLDGNGQVLNDTLGDFATAVETLSNQRDDLFGTVTNLQDFTTTIANSDATIRRFNTDLADVAAQLEGEKEDLALAIRQLSVALGEVSTFVRDNNDVLTANVSDLADITGTLVNQKAALEEFLDTAPSALSNLQLAYNPSSSTLDTRTNNVGDELPATLCGLLTPPDPLNPGGLLPPELSEQLGGLLNNPLITDTVIAAVTENCELLLGTVTGAEGQLAAAAPQSAVAPAVLPRDTTLSDLYGAGR